MKFIKERVLGGVRERPRENYGEKGERENRREERKREKKPIIIFLPCLFINCQCKEKVKK